MKGLPKILRYSEGDSWAHRFVYVACGTGLFIAVGWLLGTFLGGGLYILGLCAAVFGLIFVTREKIGGQRAAQLAFLQIVTLPWMIGDWADLKRDSAAAVTAIPDLSTPVPSPPRLVYASHPPARIDLKRCVESRYTERSGSERRPIVKKYVLTLCPFSGPQPVVYFGRCLGEDGWFEDRFPCLGAWSRPVTFGQLLPRSPRSEVLLAEWETKYGGLHPEARLLIPTTPRERSRGRVWTLLSLSAGIAVLVGGLIAIARFH